MTDTITNDTTQKTITVVPTSTALQSKSNVTINLTPQQSAKVKEIVAKTALATMESKDVALFGAERQVAFSKALDGLLQQINKGNSPLLFTLFRELRDAGEKADIPKLELDIRNSLKRKWWQALLESVHLSNAADRVAAVNRSIGNALTSKTTTLLSVMQKMENTVNDEMQKLIQDSQKLDILAKEFIANGQDFAVSVEAGRQILDVGQQHLLQLQNEANGDMLKVQQAKDFKDKVMLFDSRLTLLETAYVKSFGNLDAVGIAKGASVSTIAETANSVLSEFTDIKTALVQLNVSYQIQSVQALNAQRRELRDKLQTHATNVLADVSVNAARMQGDNRLGDAQQLNNLVNQLKQIGTSVETEHTNNTQKFNEARGLLSQAQQQLALIETQKTKLIN